MRGGSSPLARGLLIMTDIPRPGSRIIPARAGFTPWPTGRPGTASDHPRSRGVYPPSTASLSGASGSSPLARGLLYNFVEDVQFDRIIPARAGFTRGDRLRAARRLDHPRSRGVYRPTEMILKTDVGSSPLARGLPIGALAAHDAPGIIPARAGFTS